MTSQRLTATFTAPSVGRNAMPTEVLGYYFELLADAAASAQMDGITDQDMALDTSHSPARFELGATVTADSTTAAAALMVDFARTVACDSGLPIRF